MERDIRFLLNDSLEQVSLPPGQVVLDFLRRDRRLTGTREGCREGDCGACLVLLGELQEGRVRYRPVNSCLLPLGELEGRHLATIEGLNPPSPQAPTLNPVQQALVEQGAIQCGFCTPGFVLALTAFFLEAPRIEEMEALGWLAGNICRCTGYASIRRAVAGLIKSYQADEPKEEGPGARRLERLIAWGLLPGHFRQAPARLAAMRRGPGPAERPERVLVAGGTDLFVQRPEALLGAGLEFLSGRGSLAGVRGEGGRVVIGAATPMEDLRGVQPFGEYLELIGSSPIRNRATVGGNIVNASPIGDLTIMLLALGAVLSLRGPRGLREIALDRFYRGYKKLELSEGEALESVSFPALEDGRRFSFEKVSRRRHLDIASVNSAACLKLKDGKVLEARLSAGGVAPVPLYLRRTSEAMSGREADSGTVKQAMRLAQEEASPISDVRGSAEYKRLLLRQLLIAHFLRLAPGKIEAEKLL
jgi:xanthine dehydrogenase small subunit